MDAADRIRKFLQEQFSEAVIREENFRGELVFYVKPDSLVEIIHALHENDELDIKFLSDITSLDWFGHARESGGRFEVIYNLYSLSSKQRLFLKVRLEGDSPAITTLSDLFAGANWLEREVFDLMGIRFDGHPNLTKILTPDDLEGHPLRRDYPLTWEQPVFSWNKDDPPEVIK